MSVWWQYSHFICNIVSRRQTIILCSDSIKGRSSTNPVQATSQVWLKGQISWVLKVNVQQHQDDNDPLLAAAFYQHFTILVNSHSDYCLHVCLQLFSEKMPCLNWRNQGFQWSWKQTSVSGHCVQRLSIQMFLQPWFSRRNMTVTNSPTPHHPSPLCQSVSLSPTHRRWHSLVVVRGGASSVGEMILPVSLAQRWQRWEEHGPHRGNSSTPLSAAVKVGALAHLGIFTKLLPLKATKGT